MMQETRKEAENFANYSKSSLGKETFRKFFISFFGEENFESLNENQKGKLLEFVEARQDLVARVVAISIALENKEEIPSDTESLLTKSERAEGAVAEAIQAGIDMEILNKARSTVDLGTLPIEI